MTYLLWALQALLGLGFLMSGLMKVTQPVGALAIQMEWAAAVPEGLIRFIGIAEVLGGVGLIAPAVTRILPRLTPLAAAGLALNMLLATVFHLTRGEPLMGALTLALGALAALVAYGRWVVVPIRPRDAPSRATKPSSATGAAA